MIKGAYSDKYKAVENEQGERLREKAKLEGKNIQDRVKELSKETNRRRRALENKKKQLEEEEEKQREELLAERRKLKDEATQKFQKESLQKKKTRPNSGRDSTQTGSPQLQDGVRIVRGHVVEIKDGQQITRAAPTLEDALKLVNSPYKDLKDHEVQYYGPKDMYQELGDDHTKLGTLSAPIMNQGQFGTLSGLSGAHNPYYESDFSIAPSNYGNQGNSNNYGSEGYDIEREEQIRLRESALQNGGPKFAFMNENWTDGELPQTMGKHSPAGSLTSLDSLDEVPSDNLVTKDMLCPAPSVTGIIVKDSRTKSAPRRRVTFSDSIEFDDGLTGELVTAEKASCKQYVKLYNSRIAANNAYNASMSNAHRPTAPMVKGVHSGGVVGTPGSTPMKSNGPASSASLQSGSSASMIVPKSIYSQIPFSGNKTVATTGEATSSSMTYTDHPIQSIAQAESRTPSAPRPPGQYGTSSLGTREMDSRSNRKDEEHDNSIVEVKDSLDVVRDSLECTGERIKQEHTTDEGNDSLTNYTEEQVFEGETTDGSSNKCREPMIREGTQEEFHHVDYYGHPTNIYRNPFGQKISTEEASQTFNTTTSNMAAHSSSTQILTTSSGITHTLASSSAGQHEGAGHRGDHEQDRTQQNGSKSASRESSLSGNDSIAKNSAYYRSWYPGSFFPSKPQECRDRDVNGDDEVFEQAGYTKKNNSVAFNIVDEPPKQRKQVTDSRQMNQRNENICDQGTNTDKYTSNVQGTPDRDRYGTGYTATKPQATYTTMDSKRTASAQSTGHPSSASRPSSKDSNNSDNRNRGQKVLSPAGGQGMTAKPPHPSTRHKGVVYSSPLHRKRAAHAVRHHTGKTSPRGRKTVIKKKEDPQERNVRNQKKNDRKNATKKAAGVESDEDEMIQSIKRDMERISMRCNSSPAQEEHQNIIRSINMRGHHIDSPLGSEVPDQNDLNQDGSYTKSDFRTVYKKVHQPRVGSAKPRGQKNTPNKVPPSRIPTYVGTASNGPSRAGEEGRMDGINNSANPAFRATPTWSAEQSVPTYANELHHPQTTNLKRSISLDKTPTDDEINILWDRVRNCLHHKDTQSVGSDSCVNRIDVRRSQAKQFIPQGSQDNTLRDSETSRDRSSSIAGMGTIGGLRRYGSHEVLRRYGSADNLGYRPQPLLQHRALRTRQSGQGKPPIIPRQQMNFSPMASRQAPSLSLSTRAAPIPLTQMELRAVMKASQQTQDHLFTQHYETTPEQTQGYQHFTNVRKAPSALSVEENRLLESLDRLNERLKVQEAITSNLTHKRTHSATPLTHSRPASKQRASSSTYRYKQ